MPYFTFSQTTSRRKISLVIGFFTFFVAFANGQVFIFEDPLFGEQTIYLVGPKNVSKYFPGQSEYYINRYSEMINQLEVVIPEYEKEILKLDDKTITNKNKLGRTQQNLEKCQFELDFLYEFVFLWETHKSIFDRFHEEFSTRGNLASCICFEKSGDVFCQNDLDIQYEPPRPQNQFDEIIYDEYQNIRKVYNSKGIELITKGSRHPNSTRRKPSPNDINEETTELIIQKFSIQKKIEHLQAYYRNRRTNRLSTQSPSSPSEYFQEKFYPFQFDDDKKELYRTITVSQNQPNCIIKIKDSNKPMVPDSWNRYNCDE